MAKKLKKIFRHRIKEKKFNKKLLGRVFLKDDREILLGAYEKKEGFFLLKDIDEENVKKLNRLADHIKKNSGALGMGKTGAALVLAAAFVIFTVFFQNMLAEKGLETALEKVFRAQSEVTGLRLSLFGGYIRYSSMEVADSGNPDRNLFETGKAVIDIDMYEALKGKFAAEEISLESFSLGTRREKRAYTLPQNETGTESGESGGGESIGGQVSVASFAEAAVPDRDAVRQAVEDNLERLKAFAVADKSLEKLEEGTDEIKKRISDTEAEIEKLKSEINQISSTKLKSPLDIAGAKKLYERINASVKSADMISANIRSIRKETENLRETASSAGRDVENAVSDDVSFIVSLFPAPGDFSISSLAESAVRERLSPFMEKYGTAFEIISRITESRKKAESEGLSGKRMRGRDVSFPVKGTPDLHIRKIKGSYLSGSDSYSAVINDITDNQELLGKPLLFSINTDSGGIKTEAEGFFDTRDEAKSFSGINAVVTGGRIKSANFLSPAGIESFSSSLDISAVTEAGRDKNFSGKVEALLAGMEMDASTETGSIIKRIVSGRKELEFEIMFSYSGKNLSVKIETPLDSLLSDAVSPENVASEVKVFAAEKLAEVLEEKSGLRASVEKDIASLSSAADLQEKRLKDSRSQLEAKLKTLPRL